MNTEFDWFMITMPIFALVVYFILMVGSMEKEPEILRSEGTQKVLGVAFFGLKAIGGVFVLLLLRGKKVVEEETFVGRVATRCWDGAGRTRGAVGDMVSRVSRLQKRVDIYKDKNIFPQISLGC